MSTAPTGSARRDAYARVFLGAFALAATADLVCLLADADLGHRIAKPLLMLALAAYAARRGPRLLVAALLFGWGGDVLLLSDADPAFMAGMGSFAAGHVCYLVLFARVRARPSKILGAGYALVLATTITLLWNDLPAGLRLPVAGYSLLLTVMAWRASGLGRRAAIGGALFLLSDTLIAAGIADWPRLPAPAFWVMATYIAAQGLLAAGVLKRAGAAAPDEVRAAPSAYREGRTTV
ncbi:lysoplasmalogenase [Streptomyces hypolithicus]